MAPRVIDSDDSDADVPLGAVKAAAGKPALNGNGPATNGNGKRTRSASSTNDPSSKPASKRSKISASGSKPPSPATTQSQSSNGKQPQQPAKKRKVMAASSDLSSDSDEDIPLASPAKQVVALAIPPPPGTEVVSSQVPLAADAATTSLVPPKVKDEDDSDDDVPIKSMVVPKKKDVKPRKSAAKLPQLSTPAESSDGDDESDDEPIVSKKRRAPKAKAPAPKKKPKKEESDADDVFNEASSSQAKPARKPRASTKATAAGKAKKSESVKPEDGSPSKKTKKQEEEEEEQFRWWEAEALGDGSQKWETLEHNGVLFPPAYEPLPADVKMFYNGKPVRLPPPSEEVAGFFATMLETDHAANDKFRENFFEDFLATLEKYPPLDNTKITSFDKCDFTKMYEHFEAERARKKALPAAEKKALKAAKDEAEAQYTYCLLDGRKEKVGNFRAEPPGLFRGRGDHPKKGKLKFRLRPEDITINIGKDVPVPKPNVPGHWGKIVHDNTVTWLAHWKENINGNAKYVFLAAGSSLKGQSDMQKFEKARELKKHVDAVRADYNDKLKSRVTAERQLATALYFIDRLALRAGNEKGSEEADTVGCCSLRYEHVTLKEPEQLVFDFLGKDSIRYYNVVDVEPRIYKNIRLFKDGKVEGDSIFDRVTTQIINKHLNSYMDGLTAKVFRTYNASITFQQQLDERTPKGGSLLEKLAAYNEANRMVAILCNHQKSVSKNHSSSMEKLENQIRAIKYQRRKLRYALFTMDKKYRKQKDLAADESDIDDNWIAAYEDESRAKEIEKATKKFGKDNEKRAADGDDALEQSVLDEKIAKINEEYDRLVEERGSQEVEVKGKKTEEAILAAIEKCDMRIKTERFKMDDKEKGKEVSLGTSKINYLDPRITTAWCKTHGVPIEKMFNKSLIVKFPWAMEVSEAWKF